MSDDELKQIQDQARIESALVTVKDVLFRTEELCAGSYSAYDLLSFLVEDLSNEGLCPACLNDAVVAGFQQAGANTAEHKPEAENSDANDGDGADSEKTAVYH